MIQFDNHTHTNFSHDGRVALKDMIASAKKLGLNYLAITDHFDLDCTFGGYEYVRQLDYKEYISALSLAKEEHNSDPSNFYLAMGVECGFYPLSNPLYAEILPKYNFDVIINSVHNVLNQDPYYPRYFMDKSKKEAYLPYLEAILESVNAPYSYDIIGHLGYISRYSPYPDRELYSLDLKDLIDEILLAIIKRDVSLEINTHTKDLPIKYLPELNILKRYRELGGTNLTFGSDAHDTWRLLDKQELVIEVAKSVGFRYLNIYKNRIAEKISII